MSEVNIIALNHCTQLAVKSMIKVCTTFCHIQTLFPGAQLFQHKIEDGQVIFVNSMAGHRVAAMSSKFYTATKYAVSALLEGWRLEVQTPEHFKT